MKSFIRLALGFAALFAARAALADDGTIRVAVAVDFTPEGANFVRATPDHPVYYAPVVTGDEDRGAILTYYQRPSPPVARVEEQIAKALADRSYHLAAVPSAASIVLDFQWGYIAPQTAPGRGYRPAPGRPINMDRLLNSHGWITNWEEMATYIIGENWYDLTGRADPGTAEIFNDIRDVGPDGRGSRYYLLVSAFDGPAYLQHKAVLLWRAHVSTDYWGHYLDEVLPTLIDTGALMAGRETNTPQMITVPLAGWDPVRATGTPSLTSNQITPPAKKS